MTGYCVTQRFGHLIIQSAPPAKAGNKSVSLSPNPILPYEFGSEFAPNKTNDSLFFCFKIDFTDSTRVKKAYPQIFFYNRKSEEMRFISDSDYNRIESFLIKNGYFKVF